MRAKDVMTAPAICVSPETSVAEIVRVLLARRISAVPVVDDAQRLVGIVSEGDLVRRVELGTERTPSWWLALFDTGDAQALEYAKSRGRRAADVMTRPVVSIDEEMEISEIATLLERHRIKRVPVVRDGKVVGIVSRANLLQGLVAQPAAPAAVPSPDATLRDRIIGEMNRAGVDTTFVNVVVGTEAVHLWGLIRSAAQLNAAHIAAERVAGKVPVVSHLSVPPENAWTRTWAG